MGLSGDDGTRWKSDETAKRKIISTSRINAERMWFAVGRAKVNVGGRYVSLQLSGS